MTGSSPSGRCCPSGYLFFLFAIFILGVWGCGSSIDRAATGDDAVTLSASGNTDGFIVGTASTLSLSASGGARNYDWHYTFSESLDHTCFSFTEKDESFSVAYSGGDTLGGFITITAEDGKGIRETYTATVNYPETGLTIETSCGNICSLTVGNADYIRFSASGGSGSYVWSTDWSDGIDTARFVFSGKEDSASLVYDGSPTPSGTITVRLEDSAGHFFIYSVPLVYDSAGLFLESNCGAGCQFVSGTSSQISFSASGGSGDYNWRISFENNVVLSEFAFAGSRNSAALIYNGGSTDSGIIHVTITDSAGNVRTQSIPVTGGNAYTAELSLTPDTVDVNGEVVCRLDLAYSGGNPVSGEAIIFSIDEGAASIMDADGNSGGLSSEGQKIVTDVMGQAFAGIRAGDSDSTTSVRVRASWGDGGSGRFVTKTFMIRRGLGYIRLVPGSDETSSGNVYTAKYEYPGGSLAAGSLHFELPFRIFHTDGNGNPFASQQITLSASQQTSSVASVYLSDGTVFPASVRTDSDGESEVVLYATVRHGAVSANTENESIGSFILTAMDTNGLTGSCAIDFSITTGKDTTTESLAVSPGSTSVTSGQSAGFDASGGTPPYSWKLSGGGLLNQTSGSTVVYTASTPAESAVIILTDAAGISVSSDIIPKNEEGVLSLDPSDDQLKTGSTGSISIRATGGTGTYRWTTVYSYGLAQSCFSVVTSTNAATLVYDGKDTSDGTVSFTVTDSAGASASIIIAVVTTLKNTSLEMIPPEVDSGGEVVCLYRAIYQDEAETPVAGIPVTFRILQGPAWFIDSAGNVIGTETGGHDITDASGNVFVRICAGDSDDQTSVIVEASSDTAGTVTRNFTITRNLGTISFEAASVPVWEHKGDMEAGTIYWALPIIMTHTDGNGNPLANEAVTIDAYLPGSSIASVKLGDKLDLPATLTTDDDGISEFVLEVAVAHGFIPEDTGPVSIGNLVLTGETSREVRGSVALVFEVQTTSVTPGELAISPSKLDVMDGQIAGFTVTGGISPYRWTLSGSGSLTGPTNEPSVVYQASTPAGNAVIIVYDADGNSVSVNITARPGNLAISPSTLEVVDGQIAGFTVTGGVLPYRWTLSGSGSLAGATNEPSVVYHASTPAGSATIIVYDADGNSVSVNITASKD